MTEETEQKAEQFQLHRNHLKAVAYRLLGSAEEAEDAVQEAWFRLQRVELTGIENVKGWLTTVVSRIGLDMLRSRRAGLEVSEEEMFDEMSSDRYMEPEREVLLADAVEEALAIVLQQLKPAERLAFVLHDVFAVPFTEIASIIGKSESAARQLASRARRKVHGKKGQTVAHRTERDTLEAFLTAAYAGDFSTLLSLLDPEVVLRDDRGGEVKVVKGAERLAKEVAGKAQPAQFILVDGKLGLMAARNKTLLYILSFKLKEGIITEVELISDKRRMEKLKLSLLGG